jgi:hypothetical protein
VRRVPPARRARPPDYRITRDGSLAMGVGGFAVVYAWYIHLFVPTDYVVMYVALSLHTFVPTYLYLCIHRARFGGGERKWWVARYTVGENWFICHSITFCLRTRSRKIELLRWYFHNMIPLSRVVDVRPDKRYVLRTIRSE